MMPENLNTAVIAAKAKVYDAKLELDHAESELRIALLRQQVSKETSVDVAMPAPQPSNVLIQRGVAAREMNDAEGAIALVDQAIAGGCRESNAYALKASCLGDLCRYGDALSAVDKALAVCTVSERDGILHERGFQRLLSKDWGGWEDWEHRIQRRQLGENLTKAWPGIKEWNGEPNQWVLVSAEKGLGDSILFARYLRVLIERGCKVQLLCSKASAPMAALMHGTDGIVGVYTGEDSIPTLSSHWIALESLPKFTKEIPAPSDFGMMWKPNFSGRKRRVGICWHGNLEYSAAQSRRPQDLRDWEPVTDLPGIDFISLQLGEQGPCPFGLSLDSSLRDTLKTICSCDLVVSTDTSVVHMAGTVGCPTWMPLHRLNYWPWIMSADDVGTVWYPSMRIFRQRTAWRPVFDEMAACMEPWNESGGALMRI